MNFKKYLLAGGLASILVLGACEEGALEEDPGDTPQETEDTEDGSEVDEEETSDSAEETIEDSGESLDEDEEPEPDANSDNEDPVNVDGEDSDDSEN